MARNATASDRKERHTGTEMKKILSLILALSCIFSCLFVITSCDDGNEEAVDPDKAFFDVVAASKATQIKTLTYYTAEGEKEPFNGRFETSIKPNGDFTFEYSFTRVALPTDAFDSTAVIEGNRATFSDTVEYKAGKYYSKDGTELPGLPADAQVQPKLNLSRDLLGEYEINEAKTSITTTLSVEEAEAVLGIKLKATSDVVIKISTNGSYLTLVSITYEIGTSKVRVDTSYS